MKFVKLVSGLLWVLLVGILFVLAIRNNHPVTVRFYLGQEWNGPLVIALAAAVAVGMVLGLLALMSSLFRARRQIAKLQRELRTVRPVDMTLPPPEPGGGDGI
jgi:putative membrane protein